MTNIIKFKPIRRCSLCKKIISTDEPYKITLLTSDGSIRVYDYDSGTCKNQAIENAEESPEIYITDRTMLSERHLRLSIIVVPMPERILIK